MALDFPIKRMHELCEITSSKRIFAADYVAEGVPFFRGKEVTEKFNGAISVATELFITRDKFEDIKAKFGAPKGGDLLLTSVGTLGSTYVVKPDDEFYFKDGNLTWFRNFNGLDSNYLNYWLRTPAGVQELKKCTIGSSQSALTIVLLKQIEIAVPPLECQRRIAAILSAYDDLIENNTRRIAVLEEMARRIYEEWFVHYRYPSHEQTPKVETELGLVPQGWEVGMLDRLLVLQRGFDLPAGSRVHGQYPIIAASGINGYHHEKKVNGPGIVTGRSGTIGKVMYIEGDYWPLNTALWVKDFALATPLFAFHLLSRIDFAAVVGGAAVPSLNRNHVHAMKVVVPSKAIIEQFDVAVSDLHKLARNLEKKNANLRQTRDLLLPRLISGELDVSTLVLPETAE